MKHRHKMHKKAMGGAMGGDGGKTPALVSGNPKVVAAAKETKSIGEVPGIYAKKRLDRPMRKG